VNLLLQKRLLPIAIALALLSVPAISYKQKTAGPTVTIQRLKDREIVWSDFAGTQGAVGTVRTDAVRQIFLRDPDGYWIEINDALKTKTK